MFASGGRHPSAGRHGWPSPPAVSRARSFCSHVSIMPDRIITASRCCSGANGTTSAGRRTSSRGPLPQIADLQPRRAAGRAGLAAAAPDRRPRDGRADRGAHARRTGLHELPAGGVRAGRHGAACRAGRGDGRRDRRWLRRTCHAVLANHDVGKSDICGAEVTACEPKDHGAGQ